MIILQMLEHLKLCSGCGINLSPLVLYVAEWRRHCFRKWFLTCLAPSHYVNQWWLAINSLAPGRSGYNSKNGIFNFVLLIGVFRSSDNALRWMPQDLTDDKSTLVQVMDWCRQATSHYLSQCWPSSLPYGVTTPQWVLITPQVTDFSDKIINTNQLLPLEFAAVLLLPFVWGEMSQRRCRASNFSVRASKCENILAWYQSFKKRLKFPMRSSGSQKLCHAG